MRTGRIFRNGGVENFHFALTLLSSDLIGKSICEESARRTIGLDRNEYKKKNWTIPWQQPMWSNGEHAGLLLIGFGFDATLGFHFILNELGSFNA